MRTRISLAISFTLCCAALLHAAQPDIPALRAAKLAATRTFLDRKQPEQERLAAAQRMGFPEDETRPALLRLASDASESDAVRLRAFQFLSFDDGYLDAALKVLNDPNDGGPLLDAGLVNDINRRLTFTLRDEDMQRILRVFRKLLADPRDAVRLAAFRAAVSLHDTVAIETLTASLRKGSGVPIPLAEAIHLLYMDGPQFYVAVLRPYLDNSDPHVQAGAALALAVDPESRSKIVSLMTSSGAAEEVRVGAIRGLSANDAAFTRYALEVIANRQENPNVRYAAMHAYVGRMNYNALPAEVQINFAQIVERVAAERTLAGTASGAHLLKAAQELFEYLKRAFPAIQAFYANPR